MPWQQCCRLSRSWQLSIRSCGHVHLAQPPAAMGSWGRWEQSNSHLLLQHSAFSCTLTNWSGLRPGHDIRMVPCSGRWHAMLRAVCSPVDPKVLAQAQSSLQEQCSFFQTAHAGLGWSIHHVSNSSGQCTVMEEQCNSGASFGHTRPWGHVNLRVSLTARATDVKVNTAKMKKNKLEWERDEPLQCLFL